jgi:pilus assembly protein Flp/PilA
MRRFICTLTGDIRDRGASAVEYGLMVAAIAAVIVGIVFGLGNLLQDTFAGTCDKIVKADPKGINSDEDCKP